MMPDDLAVDFARPLGEPALLPPDSVSWRVFKNPVAMFVGGVAAVILELAEPRVRAGVWEHSRFRADPVRRLQRTGLAAMVTVYAAQSVATAMIEGVVRMHDRVAGVTEAGLPYRANDVELLDWVQATAAFGFIEGYHAYVRPVGPIERDLYYGEGPMIARAYGASGAADSQAALDALFAAMRPKLERSAVVFEFLRIMRSAPILPRTLLSVQSLFVRAAVDILPDWARRRLGLGPAFGLRVWERPLVHAGGAAADRVVLRSSPAVQASRRLGLPEDYLFRR